MASRDDIDRQRRAQQIAYGERSDRPIDLGLDDDAETNDQMHTSQGALHNKSQLLKDGQKKALAAFITEGNDVPTVTEPAETEPSQEQPGMLSLRDNMLHNQKLASEFEPNGSQNFQYMGHFVPILPPMREPAPPVPDNEGARQALQGPPANNMSNLQDDNENEEEESSCIPLYDFSKKLYRTYDGPFLFLLGMQNVNHGLWSVAILATQDLFKTYLKLNPGQMTLYMSIVHLPWSVKILYGLISDNIPIAGTHRKSYVIMMGILQFCALIAIYFLHEMSALLVAVCLMMAALSEAFVNVVADAIMCVQARRDPESGSQDLIAFSWMATGIGGILGSFLAGILTQYYHPRYSFLLYSFMGIVVAVIGSYLTLESEQEQIPVRLDQMPAPEENQQETANESIDTEDAEAQRIEKDPEAGFCEKLGINLKHIFNAMVMPEMYLVVLFFIFNGLISPDFGDFSYYYMLNVAGISKFQYSMLGTVGQFTTIFGSLGYETFLKGIEVRTVLFWSTLISCVSGFCSFAFAMRWNVTYLGVNDIIFIILTDTIFGVISLAMNTLPTLALFAKITPHRIEGTIFAFLTGTFNLANNVLSPMVGVAINEHFVHVTADDLSGYPKLCLINFLLCFLALPFLYMIPLKEDIEQWQKERTEAKQIARKQRKEGREGAEIDAIPVDLIPGKKDPLDNLDGGASHADTQTDANDDERPLLQV